MPSNQNVDSTDPGDGGHCRPAAEHRWTQALAGLHADALDCLQTTLALLADHAHGRGTHTLLGVRWRFPTSRGGGPPTLLCSLPDRLAEAASTTGLIAIGDAEPVCPDELISRVDRGGPLYVVADAYDIPWTPYRGQAHMPHSFLLEGGPDGSALAVDAYHNDTAWGAARPGAWTLSPDGLRRIADRGVIAVVVEPTGAPQWPERAVVRAADAAAARAAGPDIDRYMARLLSGSDRVEIVEEMVLDIWQLARERRLHALWFGDDPFAAVAAESAAAWQRLAAQSYVALRRMQRGGAPGRSLAEQVVAQLRADAAAVAPPEPMPIGLDVRTVVVETVCDTLQVSDGAVRAAGVLRALPGFNSYRLVDVVDRIEERLGVELTAELTAADLQDVDGLCRLFAHAGRPR